MIKIINSDGTITVSGFLNDVSTEGISIMLYDPNEKLIAIGQHTTNAGHYSEVFSPNSLWTESGKYTVKIAYSSELSADFNYTKDKLEINYDLSYPDFCISPSIPDLNCDDISYKNFYSIAP